MTDRIGQQLGRYRLIRLLGKGSFGDVYLGEDEQEHTQVAVKVLKAQLSPKEMKQFITEARTINLKHQHIVALRDFGSEDDILYLVMDYAPYGTLRQRHPKGTQVPLSTIVSYVKQLADALQYAHDQGLIHRDVKPENILVGQSQHILLSDFGIALIAKSTHDQSLQRVAGTLPYMAPEQCKGHPRRASDQYALGIVVYEWLCGTCPFNGTGIELITQHVLTLPPPLRERVPTLSPAIEEAVLKTLAKEPQERFERVQDFAVVLEQASQATGATYTTVLWSKVPSSEVQGTPSEHAPSLPNEALSSSSAVLVPPSLPEPPATPSDADTKPPLPMPASSEAASQTSGQLPANERMLSFPKNSFTIAASPASANQHVMPSPYPETSSPPPSAAPLLPTASPTERSSHRRSARSNAALLIGLVLLVIMGSIVALASSRFVLYGGNLTPTVMYHDSSSPGAMFGYDVQHTRYNPHEQTLAPGNVIQLVPDWSASMGRPIYSSPAVTNRVVYVGSFDTYLYAFNAQTGQQLWRAPTDGPIYSSPAVAGNMVYVGSAGGNLYAFNAQTGKQLWVGFILNSANSSPTVAAGKVYVGSADGNLYAFDAQTGKQLWKAPTKGPIASSPAVASGEVYIGSNDGKLYVFDAQTGAPWWTSQATGNVIGSSPAVANGEVYVGSSDGTLYAFNIATCARNPSCLPAWKASISVSSDKDITSSPAVANGMVYIGSQDHTLYAFNISRCESSTLPCSPIWSAQTRRGIESSPAVANGVVYIGSDDKMLYAFNASAGTLLWHSPPANDIIYSSPTVANGVVYVVSFDGQLYAFHLPA